VSQNPYAPPRTISRQNHQVRTRRFFDARADPLGAALVVLPPTIALLALLVPRFPLNPIFVPALALIFIVLAEAPKWRLSRLFWCLAAACLWPISLPGYLYARRENGALTAWWLGVAAILLHFWITSLALQAYARDRTNVGVPSATSSPRRADEL
jgi:hypothetical protein